MPLVILQAWAWLKTHWKWLILPVGVVIWLLGRGSKQTTVQVVNPELSGHVTVKDILERKAAAQTAQAVVVRDQKIGGINQDFDTVTKSLDAAAARQAEAVRSDPAAVNDFLKGVGKSVRRS